MGNVVFDYVRKEFGGVAVVDDLSLEVEDGEFLVLVGPSGCGKSTALRCLAGLEDVTSGRMYIGGTDVTHLSVQERDIAMVFQHYALYPHMTVRRNMEFGLQMRDTPPAEIARRVAAASALLGIDGLLERKPRQLSGGQRQRVALGRAMVREPGCFLMDEPLSNLDAKLRSETRAEIIKLQRRLGTTTIYVTHDQVEAMTMGDRIAVMEAGRLQQVDVPQVLYDAPANRFVATFIGNPAMNILPARSEAGEIHTAAFCLPAPRPLPKQVLLGIRPEGIELLEFAHGSDGSKIDLQVDVVEHLGAETLLHLRLTPDETLIARVDARCRAVPGDVVTLVVDTDKLHFFDPETELALR